MLLPLRALIASMDARDTCPQIEVACGDHVTALVLRHLEPLSGADLQRLRDFAAAHGRAVVAAAQGAGYGAPASTRRRHAAVRTACRDFGITMPFKPTDFTQVNPHINRVLVTRALRLLDAQKDRPRDRLVLRSGQLHAAACHPGARGAGHRGLAKLWWQRSRENYAANNAKRGWTTTLAPTDFVARNLFKMTPEHADGRRRRRQVAGGSARARAPLPCPRRWPISTSRPASAWLEEVRPRCPAGVRGLAAATAHRRTSAATPPRWRAMPACWCTRRATAAWQRAWSTCSRTRPTWKAWPCLSAVLVGVSAPATARPTPDTRHPTRVPVWKHYRLWACNPALTCPKARSMMMSSCAGRAGAGAAGGGVSTEGTPSILCSRI